MDNFVAKLLEFGSVRPNPNASWAAAPLLVQNDGPSKYRLTFHYRTVNAVTVHQGWPSLHIESELMDLSDREIVAKLDLCQGYCQMPLHRDFQHLHSFSTLKGHFQPTRTAQGVTNGCSNVSSRVETCFQKVREKHNTEPFKAWLDDLLVHAKDADEMVNKLELVFECCEEYNLKLSAMKCELFCAK